MIHNVRMRAWTPHTSHIRKLAVGEANRDPVGVLQTVRRAARVAGPAGPPALDNPIRLLQAEVHCSAVMVSSNSGSLFLIPQCRP
jgi:hypothetical protein